MSQSGNDDYDKSDILELKPFDVALYEGYALTSLAAYCVFWLHTWSIPTSLENVAVASYRMFPAKFALVGWPQFPDVNRINRTVLQMRPKYRNLATSASDKGVFLNENGIRESSSLTERIGGPLFEGETRPTTAVPSVKAERGVGKPRSIHPEDLMSKVRKSHLFALYVASHLDEGEAIDLINLLGVYDHTPSKHKRAELKKLIDSAKEVEDTQVFDFMKLVAERFRRYLNK